MDTDGDPQRSTRRAKGRDIDRHVGRRIRSQRILLGLSHQDLAERIGITCQQEHNYEKGMSSIAAARLYVIAKALDVNVDFFFQDVDVNESVEPAPQQRMLLELARSFLALPNREQQEAICALTHALAGEDRSKVATARRWDRTPKLSLVHSAP
jgi:transcriptional regulator with XRE-family HTH domain